jgi:hypothetical protein
MTLPQTPPPTLLPNYSPSSAQLSNYSGYPADPQIAVSTTHVVVTARAVIAFYDKTGNLLNGSPKSTRIFFSALDLKNQFNIEYYYDTRTIFDSYRKRFWICALCYDKSHETDTNRRELVVIAVSKTENPNSGWYLYWTDAVAHYGLPNDPVFQSGDCADYPILGVDKTCLYQTNQVNNNQTDIFRYWRVSFFPANELANGSAATGYQYWGLTDPNGDPSYVIQPAVHHGSNNRAYFASTYESNKILIWGLKDPLKATQQIDRISITVSPFIDPPSAPQKDSTDKILMNNVHNEPLKAVCRNNKLYLCMNDAKDWFKDNQPTNSIRLVRINVNNFPKVSTNPADSFINRVFGANNPLEDSPKTRMYYGWPAVEVNKSGDIAIVYTRTGDLIYPQMRYTAYLATENDVRPSRIVKEGEASYKRSSGTSPLNWGDVAGASVDPVDDTTIWIAHQYATATAANSENGNFDVWIAKVFS